jgi:hypothetical protein
VLVGQIEGHRKFSAKHVLSRRGRDDTDTIKRNGQSNERQRKRTKLGEGQRRATSEWIKIEQESKLDLGEGERARRIKGEGLSARVE